MIDFKKFLSSAKEKYVDRFRLRYPFLFAFVVGAVSMTAVSVLATSVGSDITTANLTATGALGVQTTTGTSTLSTGGFNVGSGQFVVQQTSGMTAVASTTPWGLFSVEETTLDPVFVVGDKGSTSPLFIISGNGRVGVGTSTPASLLSLQGNLLLSGTSSMAGLIATGTVLVSTEGGNTGVGTTTPVQKLSVGGSLFVGASAVGGTAGGLGVGNATTTAGVIENTGNVLFGSSASNQIGINAGSVIYNNIGTTTIAQRNVAGWSIATSSSPAPLVRYDTTNTRVGIATGTPTKTLTVAGDVLTTGGFGIGEGAATSSKAVIQTDLSSTTPSVFQSDVSLSSTGTTTLRLGSQNGLGVRSNGGRGCIEFGNGEGGQPVFRLYATSSGFALIESGTCE